MSDNYTRHAEEKIINSHSTSFLSSSSNEPSTSKAYTFEEERGNDLGLPKKKVLKKRKWDVLDHRIHHT